MTKLDSRLREALIAARDLSGAADAPHGAGDSTRGRKLPQSTRVRALVAEQLVRMGFDATAIERELAAERAKSHRRLEELKAEAVFQREKSKEEKLRREIEACKVVAPIDGTVGYLRPVEEEDTFREGEVVFRIFPHPAPKPNPKPN